jgi:hypothetical protein
VLYQHVVLLEHGFGHGWLRMIREWGEAGIAETVKSLAEKHDNGHGRIEASPATGYADLGDWAHVGEYLLLWHAGWDYVCLERVITGAPAAARPAVACAAQNADEAQGLYGAGAHPARDQYGPADMTMYDRHRSL